MTDAEAIYWAGVFDYRGSVTRRKVHGRLCPHIARKDKDPARLGLLVVAFGGKIRNGGGGYFVWSKTSYMARDIILQIAPHMKFHREVIAATLRWRSTRRNLNAQKIAPRTVRGRAMSASPDAAED